MWEKIRSWLWPRLTWLWPQRIEVRASRFNGKIEVWRYCSQVSLRVDGLTQSGGLMEEIWGKTMKIVYSQQLSVNRILILGLGGGTAAKVVKQYWPQVKITGVDIDPVMIELGEKYLGLAGVTKIIADAVEWVAKSKQKFDGILVDVYQGRRIPKSVTSKAFLESLSQKGRWVIFNRLKFKGQNNEGFKIRLRRIWGQVEIIKTPANELLLVK